MHNMNLCHGGFFRIPPIGLLGPKCPFPKNGFFGWKILQLQTGGSGPQRRKITSWKWRETSQKHLAVLPHNCWPRVSLRKLVVMHHRYDTAAPQPGERCLFFEIARTKHDLNKGTICKFTHLSETGYHSEVQKPLLPFLNPEKND